jgi:DNA helicase II / ATP-dependent DNA helicase PcrA
VATDKKLNKKELVHSSLSVSLNKEQLRAVKYKKGPLLIIAGAGTGKTTVITERIKYLIQKGLVKPSEILALTFTEKASREMEERVDVALPLGYTQMWISTFHSFCDRVLRDNALHIGLDPRYKLMTESETIQFIRKNLFKFDLDYFRPLGNPNKFISGMIQHFSRLQDEDITPKDYIGWVEKQSESRKKARASHSAKSLRDDLADLNSLSAESKIEIQKWLELAKAYKKYDELKVKEGFMDFGDLIVKTLQLFRQRPNILKNYQKQFKYVLVDEFQDTNVAQYELLKLLALPKFGGNLTVVGDDSQSVYKFRGAAVSNILYFQKDYKKAKTIVLTKNYRSTQNILDSAYKLIQHNNPDTLESKLGIDKNLVSIRNPKNGEPIAFIHKNRVENEADVVAKEIQFLTTNNKEQSAKCDYKDIAILVRANNHSEPFIRALQRYAIPYQFLGPGRLFKKPEIVDLISYLKVLYDFDDSVSFYRLLSIDYFDINAKDLVRIGNFAKRQNLSLFEACERINDHPKNSGQEIFLSRETKDKIKKLVKIINNHLVKAKRETAGQLLYYFLQDTGLLQKLLNPDTSDAEKKAMNVSKFFDKLKTYEVDHEDASVSAVTDWIELSCELGESPLAADTDWTKENAVNILTVHSAKGLEFPVVFLVNLVSQRFPTNERREQIPIPDELIKEVLPQGDYHLQEERRLFYVGMTRAMDRLYLTAADYYGEGKREKKLSPFIFEALEEEMPSSEQSAVDSEQLSFLDYEPKAKPFEALAKEGEPITKSLPIHIDFLSYSQIETFRICPLHYKLKYIYRLPTPPSSSQSFGNTFHAVMKEFYDSVKKGEKAKLSLMYKILENKWISEGYLGKGHEERSYGKMKKFLKHYLDNLYDPKVLPIQTEQPFTVGIGGLRVGGKIDSSSHKVAEWQVGLRVGGKIDRIDVDRKGIHIIDYKTGAKALTQKEADSDLQLSIYAMAATLIPEYPFDRKPEDVKLSLFYFDTPQIVTTKRTAAQIDKAREEILSYKKQIEESDFKCSGNMLCQTCEYRLFCREDKK